MKTKYTVLGKMKINDVINEYEKVIQAESEQDAKDIFEDKLKALAESEEGDIDSIEILEVYELDEEKDSDDDDDDSDDNDDDEEEVEESKKKKSMKKESLEQQFKVSTSDISIDESDLKALFKDQELSEEFVQNVKDLFELHVVNAVNRKVDQIIESVNEYEEEVISDIKEDLENKVHNYLENVVVEEWLNENELVLRKSINNEILEDFVLNLHECFKNHYVQVPEDKVDKVEELIEQVEELEEKYNNQVSKYLELQEQLDDTMKNNILENVLTGLSDIDADKIRGLAENIEFKSETDFQEKIENLKENYSPSNKTSKQTLELDESVNPDANEYENINESDDIALAKQYLSKFK